MIVALGALRESNKEPAPALAITTTPSAATIHARLVTTFVPSANSQAMHDHLSERLANERGYLLDPLADP